MLKPLLFQKARNTVLPPVDKPLMRPVSLPDTPSYYWFLIIVLLLPHKISQHHVLPASSLNIVMAFKTRLCLWSLLLYLYCPLCPYTWPGCTGVELCKDFDSLLIHHMLPQMINLAHLEYCGQKTILKEKFERKIEKSERKHISTIYGKLKWLLSVWRMNE